MSQITDEMIQRMQDAVEGECDSLAIDEQHARAILEYVLAAQAVAVKPGEGLRARARRIGISPTTLSRFERSHEPDMKTARLIGPHVGTCPCCKQTWPEATE